MYDVAVDVVWRVAGYVETSTIAGAPKVVSVDTDVSLHGFDVWLPGSWLADFCYCYEVVDHLVSALCVEEGWRW